MSRSLSPASTSVSPRETELRVAEARAPKRGPSILVGLFQWLEDGGVWKVSFADLSGLAQCIPDLRLPLDYQLHSCEFCVHAKSGEVSWRDCVRNKHAVNRLLIRSGTGLAGPCHLGITDIVEPLLVKGKVLGAFYCGSVLAADSWELARRRIVKYCRRRGLDPEGYLRKLEGVPHVSAEAMAAQRHRLQLVANIAARLVESWGFPTGQERLSLTGRIWETEGPIPATLRKAMERVQADYDEDISLRETAARGGVTGDYLGSLFRKHLGCTFGEYLLRVRVDHARRLLETGRYSAGEVAVRIGFKDQAHFGKVFKRLTSHSPKRYALLHREA